MVQFGLSVRRCYSSLNDRQVDDTVKEVKALNPNGGSIMLNGYLRARGITADERQPWTNYVNTGNEYLINGAIVCSEYSNVRY